MMAEDPKTRDETVSLYVSETELRRRVSAKLGRDRFRAAVKLAERNGFPKIDAVWGGRYWPAVDAWFKNKNNIPQPASIATVEDGTENFDAAPKRKRSKS